MDTSDFYDLAYFNYLSCFNSLGPILDAGSDGRCNTIWYKAVFKGGVYETRKTVWAFNGAEERGVASLEVGADVA